MNNSFFQPQRFLVGTMLLGFAVLAVFIARHYMREPAPMLPDAIFINEPAAECADPKVVQNSKEKSNKSRPADDKREENNAEIASGAEIELLSSNKNDSPRAVANDDPTSASATEQQLGIPPKNMEPLYEIDRPTWLFRTPMIEDGKLVLSVGGELCSSEQECESKHADALYTEVSNYFDRYVFHEENATRRTPLTGEFIKSRWADENYLAKVQTSEGTMYQLWSIVQIDDEGMKTIKQWHLSTLQPRRIGSLGIGLLIALSGIGILHFGASFAAGKAQKKT
jgi:hypothetical protein